VNKLIPLTLAALGLATPASAQISSFQHIILVIQENRTPDNLFQGLCTPTTNPIPCSTQPGPGQYNILTTNWLDKTSPTGFTNPHNTRFGIGYDLDHAYHKQKIKQTVRKLRDRTFACSASRTGGKD
jgi:phospholipase C